MSVLLQPRDFRLLDGLRLNPRKSFSGRVRGERLTRKKGISIEFADYRDYSEGDDLRHLDWNVLARLDTPVMRTYQDEEDLAVHLLLDGSPSMEFGEPSKLDAARQIAAAIGYVALNGGDAVHPRSIGVREGKLPTLRGRSAYPRLAAWTLQKPDISLPLTQALRLFAGASVRTGLVILLSDGMDPDVPSAIRALGGRGHEIWFLQILSSIELDPDLEGDLRLVDAEQGLPVELTANSYAFKEYRQRLEAHNQSIVEAVARVGGRHSLALADQPLDETIRSVFKRKGWTR